MGASASNARAITALWLATGSERYVYGLWGRVSWYNVTEQKHYERALEHQNDRFEEFTSVVSPDLRSPLSVADGRLELARDDVDSPHLEEVAAAHDRMKGLIDDLLSGTPSIAAARTFDTWNRSRTSDILTD